MNTYGIVKMPQHKQKIDWSKHKICPKHGLSHLYVRDFHHPSQTGLCAHPDCINSQISALRHHPRCGKMVRFADHICGREELFDEVIMALSQQVAQNRLTVLHGGFMYWIALGCLKRLRKVEQKQERQNNIKEQIKDYLADEARNAVVKWVGSSQCRMFGGISSQISDLSADKLYDFAELVSMLCTQFGGHTYMYLQGHITKRDWARVEGCKLREAETMRERVKQFYLDNFGMPEHADSIEYCAL